MALQQSVGLYIPQGVVGDKAVPDQTHYHALNLLSDATNPAVCGGFVWRTNSGTAASTGSGKPLGFVERIQQYTLFDVTASGSLQVPAGDVVSTAIEGDFFAKTLTTATVGQKVFAVLADGTVKTGATGATVTGAVETDWYVVTAGSANDVIVIAKH